MVDSNYLNLENNLMKLHSSYLCDITSENTTLSCSTLARMNNVFLSCVLE